jgi:hypothetical protein
MGCEWGQSLEMRIFFIEFFQIAFKLGPWLDRYALNMLVLRIM